MSLAFAHPDYNYKVVRQFCIMTVVWGIVGMAVGVLIAAHSPGRHSISIYRG